MNRGQACSPHCISQHHATPMQHARRGNGALRGPSSLQHSHLLFGHCCNIHTCYWINCWAKHKIILPSWHLKAFLFPLMMTRGRMVGKCAWPPRARQACWCHAGRLFRPCWSRACSHFSCEERQLCVKRSLLCSSSGTRSLTTATV